MDDCAMQTLGCGISELGCGISELGCFGVSRFLEVLQLLVGD